MIKLKRVYERPKKDDGQRFLVERLWPRGMKKSELRADGWLKDVAPSAALRQWFGHDPEKWSEFRRRYFKELEHNAAAWQELFATSQRGTITLLFSARDPEHNNAVALKEFLESKLAARKKVA